MHIHYTSKAALTFKPKIPIHYLQDSELSSRHNVPEATLSPSRNSSSTLAGGDSTSSFYKQQQEEDDIKDEATAIRLAADLATKRMTGGQGHGTLPERSRLNSLSAGSAMPPSSSRSDYVPQRTL